jgi:hypothetical protein
MLNTCLTCNDDWPVEYIEQYIPSLYLPLISQTRTIDIIGKLGVKLYLIIVKKPFPSNMAIINTPGRMEIKSTINTYGQSWRQTKNLTINEIYIFKYRASHPRAQHAGTGPIIYHSWSRISSFPSPTPHPPPRLREYETYFYAVIFS